MQDIEFHTLHQDNRNNRRVTGEFYHWLWLQYLLPSEH